MRDGSGGALACCTNFARRIGPARGTALAFAAAFLWLAIAGPKPWDADAAQRFAEGRPRPADYAGIVFLWVALGNAAVCILLALTSQWWWGRRREACRTPLRMPDHDTTQRSQSWRWVFGFALLTLALFATAQRLPLAAGSLWWDEVWTVKHTVVGYRDARAGGVRFVERDWDRALWYYAKPTNHAGFSVLSRAGVDLWRALSGGEPWEFHELAFRWPSLAAGAAAVVLMGILAGAAMGPWAGLAAALLMALHPWHIRFSVDGRAFGLTMAFTLLAMLALRHLLQGRGGGWWSAYGAAIFFAMWVFPLNLYMTAALGAAGVAGFLVTHRDWQGAARFVTVNLFAAMVFLQLAAPWIPQAMEWDDVQGHDMAGPVLTPLQLKQTWASFGLGMPLATARLDDFREPLPAVTRLETALPPFSAWFWSALPAVVALGLGALAAVRKTRTDALIAGAVIVAGVAGIAVAAWKRHYYYERYIIFALPALGIAAVAGVRTLGTAFGALRGKAAVAGCLAATVLFGGTWMWATARQRHVLETRPIAPVRDVALALSELDPERKAVWLGYGLGGDTPAIYDPTIRHAFVPEDLKSAMDTARETGGRLLVFYGYSEFNHANTEGHARDAFRWLDDPSLFIEIASFEGIEDAFLHRILRYTGVDPQNKPD